MNPVVLPAFHADGTAVALEEFLRAIPENNLVWSILEFHGMGEAPNGLSIEAFEKAAAEPPNGFLISWPELKALAQRLTQTIDCLIVGADSEDAIRGARESKEQLAACIVVLEAFDSTDWSVWSSDPDIMRGFLNLSV